jgi:mycothiol system anti-sigma-R factor
VECREVDDRLGAYLDGELEPAASTSVRDHADTCAACRQRLANLESIGRMVRRAPYYQAPDGLRARLTHARTRSAATPHWLAWAAAAVVVASLAGSIVFVRSSTRPVRTPNPVDTVAQEVVSSHVRALMGAHLFDVRSTDQHTVKPWFLGKLDFSPPVEDLAPAGFPLVGGRLDHVAGQHPINLYIWPVADRTAPSDIRSIRGFQVRHWIRNDLSFWAVSDLADAELGEFVRALQR